MKWNVQGRLNQPPFHRVKGAVYMGSLNSVSQDIFTGTCSWFNDLNMWETCSKVTFWRCSSVMTAPNDFCYCMFYIVSHFFQNLWKAPVKEFNFSKDAGCNIQIYLKMNPLTSTLQRLLFPFFVLILLL